MCEPLRPASLGGATRRRVSSRARWAASRRGIAGPTGHGQDCRDGYRCHYNGGEGGGAASASVASTTPSSRTSRRGVHTDAECYSPYGYGSCLTPDSRARPRRDGRHVHDPGLRGAGLPDDVCGPGNECIGLGGRHVLRSTSATASDCAGGFGCINEDDDESTPKICFPACPGATDCRKERERCNSATPDGQGRQCIASDARNPAKTADL